MRDIKIGLGISFVMVLFTSAAHSEDSKNIVPLKPGYYVTVDTPCGKASNATLSLFTGKSFGVNCKDAVTQIDKQNFRIAETCIYHEEECTHDTAIYQILSDHEYVVKDESGQFKDSRNRFCEQSQLPYPWSTNDLSDMKSKTGWVRGCK